MSRGYALFDTRLGRCGIAWDSGRIAAVKLPARDDASTSASLCRHTKSAEASAPPAFVGKAIAEITAHLAGEESDLETLPVDYAFVSAFDRAVLIACRAIPKGSTSTYGEIARKIAEPNAARAVGAALGRNPWPIIVPCHRVVAANGKLGGFSAPGGRSSKLRLLEIEGAVPAAEAPMLFNAPAVAGPQSIAKQS